VEEEEIEAITDNKLLQQVIDRETSEVEGMLKEFQSTIAHLQ
jgi:hypothetical protein